MELLRAYLADAIAAERAFESHLRAFAGEGGDDDEVRAFFAQHAAQTESQRRRLEQRLQDLGGSQSAIKNGAASLFAIAPRVAQMGHIDEEITVQDLMIGFTVEAAECAMYEALIQVALAAGDRETADIARHIQAEEHAAADKLWSFLPSRSIIAYNMLTVAEVDPAVETKVGDASWGTSA